MGTLQPPQQNFTILEGYDPAWDFNMSLFGVLTGQPDWGAPLSMTSLDSRGGGDDNYQLTIENQGSGGHLLIPGVMSAENSGVGIVTLGVVHDAAIGGVLTVTGNIIGHASIAVDGDAGVGGGLHVVGPFLGSVAHLTGAGAASPANALLLDAGDVMVTAGNLKVGNNHGLLIAPATTPQVWMDTSNNFNVGLLAYDTKLYGLSTVMYDHTNTAQLTIASSGPAGVAIPHLGVGGPPSATAPLAVTGASSFTGTVTVVSGGLEVQLGGLAVDAGGIQVTGDSMIVGETTLFGDAAIGASSASHVAFYGAAGVTRQTVTGSRGGNAALQQVLSALANLALIVDSTTP